MRPLVITSVLTAAAAVVGARGSTPDRRWYDELDKPTWQPPPIAFPLVWTPLYGLIAWGTGRAIEQAPVGDRGRIQALTAANLVVNAGWNWAFFNRESPAAGLAVILTLDALNIALMREAAPQDRQAALALAPYLAWTGVASVLILSLWRHKR